MPKSYRADELRRAFMRARSVENNAPAEPTRARTTVGFSGESSQPLWARSGMATQRISTNQRKFSNDLFIIIVLAKDSIGTKG